jgi:hypothetical protein
MIKAGDKIKIIKLDMHYGPVGTEYEVSEVSSAFIRAYRIIPGMGLHEGIFNQSDLNILFSKCEFGLLDSFVKPIREQAKQPDSVTWIDLDFEDYECWNWGTKPKARG